MKFVKAFIFTLLVPFGMLHAAFETLTFPVILEPSERTEIYPEINARIAKINVKMGDSFKEGDMLILMENRIYQAQVLKTDKLVEKTKQDLKVKKNLYQDKLISLLDLKEAESKFADAEAENAIALKNLQATRIAAPYNGKVSNVLARAHEMPPKDKPMIELLNDEILLAKFILPSSLLTKLHKNDRVFIQVKDTGEIIPATIARFGPEINPVSATVNVEAEIDNSDGKLTSGMASVVGLEEKAFEVTSDKSLDALLQELQKKENK